MTVRDNIAFGLTIRKTPRDQIRDRVKELIRLVQLQGMAHRYPSQLSGGQRQRMALARALAAEPKLLLLDEPFGALDAKVRKELRDWLRHLHDEVDVTTIFVTHDQEEAMDVAEQIVVMNEGRIEQVGAPARALRAPRDGVRDELRRRGQPVRRRADPPARSRPLACLKSTAPRRRWSSASATSASRSGSSSSLAERRARLGAGDPRRGRGARARAGPDRLRAAESREGLRERVGAGNGPYRRAPGRLSLELDPRIQDGGLP